MQSRDFCYWLQGFFELSDLAQGESPKQWQMDKIKRHLAMVFAHEIDPSMGPKPHQDVLNHLHGEPPKDGTLIRC